MVRNTPKYEFLVIWSGLDAFIAKNCDASSFSELARYWHQCGLFCIDFHAVTKSSETPQNMRFGLYGVDWVRSLKKNLTQVRLATLLDIGTSSARFA
jgi:hypothetical protein